jgi:benzaldehyde dehydrogenase (NAD)
VNNCLTDYNSFLANDRWSGHIFDGRWVESAGGVRQVIEPSTGQPMAGVGVSGGFILAAALEQAGLPPGVLHVLPGDEEAGEALGQHPAVRMIAFTGSTAARLAETAKGLSVGDPACGRVALGPVINRRQFKTINDEGVNPFGGRGASGNGSAQGGTCSWEEYSQWQWVTIRDTAQWYPFG